MNQIIVSVSAKCLSHTELECSIHHVTYAGLVGQTGIMRIINTGGDGKDHINDYDTEKYNIEIELFNDQKDEIAKLKEMVFALVEKTKNL